MATRPTRQPAPPAEKKARFSRFPSLPMILLAMSVVALAAVFEYVVLRPRFHWFEAPAVTPMADPGARPPAPEGRPAPVLGAKARLLPGLTPVEPGTGARLDGLAEGSAAAQERQFRACLDLGLPYEVENSLGMRLRLIPAGTFLMGSPPGEVGRGDGEVQHEVTIAAPFYMGVCEVTQAQWLKLMPRNPSGFPGADRPVEEVTWDDCQAFLAVLCQQESVAEGTYRLPLETEWEYACRAGTLTAFCCGDNPRQLGVFADFADNNYQQTVRCGSRRANAFGLFDMHGNVWEWCQDYFKPYVPAVDETPAPEEEWRVIRGGNWREPAANCRSANRARLPPLSHGNMLGFRVVRLIP